MKKIALVIACAALMLGGIGMVNPTPASAGIHFSFGSGYGHYGHGHYGHRYYNRGWGGYGGWNHGHYRHYGRTYYPGHYDYHPTTIVPHGNHYDVIPGHYDYHPGHFHYGGHYRH